MRDIDRVAAGGTPAIAPIPGKSAWLGSPALRWGILAASLLIVLGLGAWALRERLTVAAAAAGHGDGARDHAGDPAVRNASGDPTLDSLGPSVSQVLSTTLGQSSSRTDGSARSAAPGPARSPDRFERDPGTDAARQRGRLHERAARALGVGHPVRQQIRIDATLQDLDGSQTILAE